MNFRLDYMPDGETAQMGVDFDLTEADLDLPAEDVVAKFFHPAISMLLDQIRKKAGKPTRHELLMAEAKRLGLGS
jgi:hypothetical protein